MTSATKRMHHTPDEPFEEPQPVPPEPPLEDPPPEFPDAPE